MKNVLIIHGIGGHAGIHWQQWLHDELVKKGYTVLIPDLPNSDHPDRQAWLQEIKKSLEGVDLEELIIVGHSLGATIALDFIEQSNTKIGGLVSVSGFAEDYGADLNSYFLQEKSINLAKVRHSLGWVAVIYGDNDPYVTQEALQYVAKALEVEPVVITNGGHLNTEAGFTEFPLLLDTLESKS